MQILAIDPGTELTAFVLLEGLTIKEAEKIPNKDMLQKILEIKSRNEETDVVIEWIESYGMAVGKEVFVTCRWCGIFEYAWGFEKVTYVPRLKVKLALCHSPRANDSILRQRVIDIYGPGKEKAIGKKNTPGPLYSIKADVWQALALGLAHQEIQQNGKFLIKQDTKSLVIPEQRI